jgi:hypothetical protein
MTVGTRSQRNVERRTSSRRVDGRHLTAQARSLSSTSPATNSPPPQTVSYIVIDVSRRTLEAIPQLLTRFFQTAMDREANLDSIRALEKQIQEHERTIIQLKRARNSLLNVSTLLPPEVLGSIFRWNVIPDGDFGGLPAASYNFLLVCHHWFQVAFGHPGALEFLGQFD